MSGIGSFSQEAYEQLQAAYAAQMQKADEQESAGVTIGKETLGVETAPLKSAWLDKTGLWQYPDGKGAYQDVEQKQQDLLAVLRNQDGEIEIGSDEEENLDEMSDEEITNMVKEILTDLEDEDDGEESEEEQEPEEEDSDLSDLSDEELDALIDQILAETSDEEEDESEDLDEESEELSAEEISTRIEQLKAELAALTETSEEDEEVEEEVDEAPEETEGEEEEETEVEDDETIENDEEESPE